MTTSALTTSRHRPDRISRRRSLPAIATALALAAGSTVVIASAAHAAVTRHDGVVEFSSVLNCDSVIWGAPYYEAGVGAVASVVYDDAVPLRAGDVFYASVEVTAVGNPYPCLDQSMRPDLTLPSGISLSISAANPIRCVKWDYNVDPSVGTPETALCPQSAHAPESGGSVGFGTASGENWTIPNGIGYEIQVPVVAAVQGIKTFTFPVRVVDGNSNPIMKPTSDVVQILPATEVPGPTPTTPATTPPTTGPTTPPTTPSTTSPTSGPVTPPTNQPNVATTVAAEVDRVVRLSRTRGAVPVVVAVNKAGSRVQLKLVVRWGGRSVAAASRTLSSTSAGVTATKLKLSRTWRSKLKGKRVKAVLTSHATAPDGSTANAADTFVVKG